MTVISVQSDPQELTLALTAEFDASPERVWQLWADPRQLERWWGPPDYPATFTVHDLRPGGRMEYHLTGPDGEVHLGPWEVVAADPPRRIVIRDADTDEVGQPSDGGPAEMNVTIEPIGSGRTRMVMEQHFSSHEALQRAVEMDMDESLRSSVGQIDAILAGDAVGAERPA